MLYITVTNLENEMCFNKFTKRGDICNYFLFKLSIEKGKYSQREKERTIDLIEVSKSKGDKLQDPRPAEVGHHLMCLCLYLREREIQPSLAQDGNNSLTTPHNALLNGACYKLKLDAPEMGYRRVLGRIWDNFGD